MTGKRSTHKHGSTRSKVAGNLGAKVPRHAVDRSFNAVALGQFLQACPEILVVPAGTGWVSCFDVFDAAAPFGGFKQSGIGRKMGEYALQQYTEIKAVTVKV